MITLKKIFQKEVFHSLKLFNFLISSLLGLFFGCRFNFFAVEYGMPHADYKISGTILSSDQNNPVKGVSVTIKDTTSSTWILDSTRTDSSGKYALQFTQMPRDYIMDLKIEDIDSIDNGEFLTKDTLISIRQSELREPSGNWYNGHVEKTVNMKIDRKN